MEVQVPANRMHIQNRSICSSENEARLFTRHEACQPNMEIRGGGGGGGGVTGSSSLSLSIRFDVLDGTHVNTTLTRARLC